MKNLFLTLCLGLAGLAGLAQSKNYEKYQKEKYQKRSEELRSEVWAWKQPVFKERQVPAEYAHASKIVLARHTEFTANMRRSLGIFEQNLTEIVREVIKLNDKNAVADYSELNFTKMIRPSGFSSSSSKSTTFVGVHVIKPNGEVREISADDIVLTKDEVAEKKAKVAIPDLQPGDILDYYIATDKEVMNDFSAEPYSILLFDDAPVLHLSFHAQLGKKFAIEHKSYNGAPLLKINKNADDDIVIDVEKKNIPPFETVLWVAPLRQLPFIRMNVSLGYSGFGSKARGTSTPGEITQSTLADVLEEEAGIYSNRYYNGYWMKIAKAQYDAIESDAKKKAKQMGLSFSDLPDQEKAAMLYYVLRYGTFLSFNIDALAETISSGKKEYDGLAFSLFCLLKAAGLKPAIQVSDSRNGYRMDDVMNASDLETTTYLQGLQKHFSIRTAYDLPFETPAEIEGAKNTKSFTFDHPAAIMSAKKMGGLTEVADGFNVPESGADKNVHSEKMSVSLAPDKSRLVVKRSTTLKGHYKPDVQQELILYEDYYEAERSAFKEEKSLIETLEDGKRSKKFVEEVKNAFAEARKKQKDAFVKEAKDWFELDITDLTDYKTDNLGVRHSSPDFIYSSAFNVNGLVKKAGNNIIVEIGKMQGSPLTIKEEQRKRTLDAYMAFARTIEYDIELEIPDGYTAEGVDALNAKVENETGFFIAEASSTAKKVTIKIRKRYKHNFETVADFNKLLLFMDASGNWTNAKILFKKKG